MSFTAICAQTFSPRRPLSWDTSMEDSQAFEKAELQSQLSNDATTKPGAPSDAEPVNDKVANAPEPADSRPLATHSCEEQESCVS